MRLRYAACYCEENVYWLAKAKRLADLPREVVFITNREKKCAIFDQRAASSPGAPVVWDYHVVLAVRREERVEVWDLDSRSGAPLDALVWLERSFGPSAHLAAALHPRFRVVDGPRFLETFSSDRAHMRRSNGRYRVRAPRWPAIVQGPTNLHRFLDLEDEFIGERLDLPALLGRWSGR